MPETTQPPPVDTTNRIAQASLACAVVGLFILPIILAPAAVILGLVGADNPDGQRNGTALTGTIAGFLEIGWILLQWHQTGVL